MRKYYKPRNVRKRNPTHELDREVNPWSLLRLYVAENAGQFCWDDLCRILGIISRESVSDYLDFSGVLDARAQQYTGGETLEQVFVHRQVAMLLKKFPFTHSDLESDPRSVAIEKWQKSEDQCRETNERIRSLRSSGDLPKWVHRARQICSDVLGDLTPDVIMNILASGKHGPGSTLTSSGNRTSSYYKYADTPYSVSNSAKVYAYAAMSLDPNWIDYLESKGHREEIPPFGSPRYQVELTLFDSLVGLDNSDRVTFVPKDARTDRPIAVGAGLNLYLQLGVKTYMEKRLKTVGVDLTKQEKNQLFAKFGSISGSSKADSETQFSTIDLASASDTISIELVRLLLDDYWFAFLDDLRHKSGTLEGETVIYQKFSAMGNGFTFPLESLIFFSICKAASECANLSCSYNDIAVYGDDIIVRKRALDTVVPALSWAGFSLNTEKSFFSGPFKESCGKDYYSGTNVRPYYLKRRIRRYKDVYHVLNSLNLLQINSIYRCGFSSLFSSLVEKLPRRERSYGPLPPKEKDPEIAAANSGPSESFINTDLSTLNGLGLRPWLSRTERSSLLASRLLKPEDFNLQSNFAVSIEPKALRYRARPEVLYFMKLRSLSTGHEAVPGYYDFFTWELSLGSDGRTTSRRESIKWSPLVRPVLNWNGSYSRHELHRGYFYLL